MSQNAHETTEPSAPDIEDHDDGVFLMIPMPGHTRDPEPDGGACHTGGMVEVLLGYDALADWIERFKQARRGESPPPVDEGEIDAYPDLEYVDPEYQLTLPTGPEAPSGDRAPSHRSGVVHVYLTGPQLDAWIDAMEPYTDG